MRKTDPGDAASYPSGALYHGSCLGGIGCEAFIARGWRRGLATEDGKATAWKQHENRRMQTTSKCLSKATRMRESIS